jgi:hypothetical protein
MPIKASSSNRQTGRKKRNLSDDEIGAAGSNFIGKKSIDCSTGGSSVCHASEITLGAVEEHTWIQNRSKETEKVRATVLRPV